MREPDYDPWRLTAAEDAADDEERVWLRQEQIDEDRLQFTEDR